MDAFGKDRMPALPTNDLRKTKAAYVQEALSVPWVMLGHDYRLDIFTTPKW